MAVYMTRALYDGKLVFTLLAQAELDCDAPCAWVYVQLSLLIIPELLELTSTSNEAPVTFSSNAKRASNKMTRIGVGEESVRIATSS